MPNVNVRRGVRSAIGVMSVLAVIGGCGMVDTGVRVVENTDDRVTRPTATPPTRPGDDEALSVDPVEVLRDDPGVSQDVKEAIAQPCSDDAYEGWFPIYSNYATIEEMPVVIINVQGCADLASCVGRLASYVYRLSERDAERIYTSEGVQSEVRARNGDLFVVRPEWRGDDSATCPTGSEMVPLIWNGDDFEAESGRVGE